MAADVAGLTRLFVSLTERVAALERRQSGGDRDRHLLEVIASSTRGLPFCSDELLDHARRVDPALVTALDERLIETAGELGCLLRRSSRSGLSSIVVKRKGRRWIVRHAHQHINMHGDDASIVISE